jgi:hypothetical protein
VHSLAGVQAAIEGGADRVCLETDPSGWKEAAEQYRGQGIALYWIWPRIIPEPMLESWLSTLEDVRRYPLTGLMLAGAGIAWTVHMQDPALRIRGSVDLNVWNHGSVQVLSPFSSPWWSLRNCLWTGSGI